MSPENSCASHAPRPVETVTMCVLRHIWPLLYRTHLPLQSDRISVVWQSNRWSSSSTDHRIAPSLPLPQVKSRDQVVRLGRRALVNLWTWTGSFKISVEYPFNFQCSGLQPLRRGGGGYENYCKVCTWAPPSLLAFHFWPKPPARGKQGAGWWILVRMSLISIFPRCLPARGAPKQQCNYATAPPQCNSCFACTAHGRPSQWSMRSSLKGNTWRQELH